MTRSHAEWWGIALIALGILLLLGNMSGMDIGDIISTWWPLLLVAWGLNMLLRRGSGAPRGGSGSSSATAGRVASDELSHSSTFGDLAIRVSSRAFRGGSVSTVFGDSEVDLSQCELADGDHWLKLSGVFGDATVVLPNNIPVSVAASTTFGDVDVVGQHKEGISASMNYESPEFQTATKRLHIQATQVFGDVVVRS